MDRETRQISSDIAETRREIDEHLQELGGRVRTQKDIGAQAQTRARRNLPALLAGLGVVGLAAGLLLGGRRRRPSRMRRAERRIEPCPVPGEEYTLP